MKEIYKQLMKQHGGSIPFSLLGGVKDSNKRKKRKTTRLRKKAKRGGRIKTKHKKSLSKTSLPNTTKLSSGTIIRNQGHLWRLGQSKQWSKL